MNFSPDGSLNTSPTIGMLNDHIDKHVKNLNETKEFYSESYSILNSYREEYFKLVKDKEKTKIWIKYQLRKSECFFKAIEIRERNPEELPYVSNCDGEVEDKESYQQNGKTLYIIQKNKEEISFEKKDHFFETYLAKMEHLHRMAIIYAFAIQESYIKEILHFFYLNYPETMISKTKKLDYEEIISSESIIEVYNYMAWIETDKFGRMNIDELRKELIIQFKIDLGENHPQWEDLRENYYRRNSITHNDGYIDDNYVEKLDRDETEFPELNYEYVISVFNNIQSLLGILKSKLIEKFKLRDTFLIGQITKE